MMKIMHEKNNYNAAIMEDFFMVAEAGFYGKSTMEDLDALEPIGDNGDGIFLVVNLDCVKMHPDTDDADKEDYAKMVSRMVYEMMMRPV